MTGVVVPIGSVANLYGFQLVLESYVFVSNGTQSDVRLIEPDWDGVQSQVVVQGAAVTDLSLHPEIICPPARKVILPGI